MAMAARLTMTTTLVHYMTLTLTGAMTRPLAQILRVLLDMPLALLVKLSFLIL